MPSPAKEILGYICFGGEKTFSTKQTDSAEANTAVQCGGTVQLDRRQRSSIVGIVDCDMNFDKAASARLEGAYRDGRAGVATTVQRVLVQIAGRAACKPFKHIKRYSR